MEFEVKLYEWNGNFKKQIRNKDIYSDIEFQEQLNSGQGNFSLQLKGALSDYQTSDIVEIRSSIDGNLYTGIIEEIQIQEYEDSEVLTLEIYGIFTALNDIIYKSGSSRVFTGTGTIGNIIKSIIDSFNNDYGSLSSDTQILDTNLIRYTNDSIDVTGASISIDFDNDDCLSAIKKVVEDTNFNFFISREGIIFVTNKSNEEEKFITFRKEILNISRVVSKKNMVNKYYLSRSGNVFKTYEDIPYQGFFGLKEESEKDTSLNEAAQDLKGNDKIANFKDETNIVSITIKPYSVDLKPGNLITTLNSRNNLVQKQITKIVLGNDEWEIVLGEFLSFGKTIVKGS